jgi:hypothetical protein
MPPVLVLEGPDHGGKTTLARWLEKEKGFKYVHEGPPPPGRDQLAYYGLQLWRALQSEKPVVFDRLHLGELTYGPVMRDKDSLGYYGMRLFGRVLGSQPALCVICLPPWSSVVEGWRKRKAKEYLRTEVQLHDVYCRYQGLLPYHPHLDYDYTSYGPADLLKELGPFFKQNSLPPSAIGNPAAKYLFIGEQANQAEIDWPWFSAEGSSRYLNECLWEAGFQEEEMTFVNAFNLRGKVNDLQTVCMRLPQLKKVIALGGKAAKEVSDQLGDLENFTSGKHPAHHKRFHSKRRQEYVDWLKSIRESA